MPRYEPSYRDPDEANDGTSRPIIIRVSHEERRWIETALHHEMHLQREKRRAAANPRAASSFNDNAFCLAILLDRIHGRTNLAERLNREAPEGLEH